MNKLSCVVVAFAFLLFVSCSSETVKQADTLANKGMQVIEEETKPDTVPDFTLDDYKGFPPEIEGCTCYFSENKEKFEKQQFLFTSNADGLCVVAINNKQLRLKQVSIMRDKDPGSNNETISVYEGEGWKVTVRITGKTRSGDEVWTNTGTITAEKDGKKLEKSFTGECGC